MSRAAGDAAEDAVPPRGSRRHQTHHGPLVGERSVGDEDPRFITAFASRRVLRRRPERQDLGTRQQLFYLVTARDFARLAQSQKGVSPSCSSRRVTSFDVISSPFANGPKGASSSEPQRRKRLCATPKMIEHPPDHGVEHSSMCARAAVERRASGHHQRAGACEREQILEVDGRHRSFARDDDERAALFQHDVGGAGHERSLVPCAMRPTAPIEQGMTPWRATPRYRWRTARRSCSCG